MKSNIIYIDESTDKNILPTSIKTVNEYSEKGTVEELDTGNGFIKTVSLGTIEYDSMADLKDKAMMILIDLGY